MIARKFAVVAVAIGVTVLAGWWLGIATLTSVVPGYVTMKPNTALGLLLGGLSLWFLAIPPAPVGRTPGRIFGYSLAAAVAAIGVVTLLEYLIGARWTFDVMLADIPSEAALTSTPGRMAVASAATFVALGAGLASLDVRKISYERLSETLLAVGLAVPLAVIVGYLYRVIPTQGIGQGIQMALHTAAGCLAIGAGGFAARPEREVMRALASPGAGGLLTRRLLPAALAVPLFLGGLRLVAERAGGIDAALGGAAVTVGTMFLLAVLAWRTASEIDRTDAARREADRERNVAESAVAAALAADAAKTQFLAVMSHELRTPLNAIAGYTQLIEMGVYGHVTAAQIDALARVTGARSRLAALIDQVLSLAQSEAGQPWSVDVTAVPLSTILANAEAAVAPEILSRAIVFKSTRPPGDLFIHADRGHAEQALLHLLSNAVKFTECGGAVTVETVADGKRVLVRVTDTGRGVPLEHHEAIFEPFVQVESGLTRTADGAGIGLAISRALARAMDGDVVLERSDSTGSTFTLTLPRADQSPLQSRVRSGEIEPATRR